MKKLLLIAGLVLGSLVSQAATSPGSIPLFRSWLQTHGNGNQLMWTNLAGIVYTDGTIQLTAGGGTATNVLQSAANNGILIRTNGLLYTVGLGSNGKTTNLTSYSTLTLGESSYLYWISSSDHTPRVLITPDFHNGFEHGVYYGNPELAFQAWNIGAYNLSSNGGRYSWLFDEGNEASVNMTSSNLLWGTSADSQRSVIKWINGPSQAAQIVEYGNTNWATRIRGGSNVMMVVSDSVFTLKTNLSTLTGADLSVFGRLTNNASFWLGDAAIWYEPLDDALYLGYGSSGVTLVQGENIANFNFDSAVAKFGSVIATEYSNPGFIGSAAGVTNIQEQALVFPPANPSAGLVLTSTSSNTAAWLASSGGSGTGIQTNGGTGTGNVFTNGLITSVDDGIFWTNYASAAGLSFDNTRGRLVLSASFESDDFYAFLSYSTNGVYSGGGGSGGVSGTNWLYDAINEVYRSIGMDDDTFYFESSVFVDGNVAAAQHVGGGNALTFDDEAYGVGWNGDVTAPTKNALYDKIETISGATAAGDIFSVQYKSPAGAFSGETAYRYNDTNDTITVPAVRITGDGDVFSTATNMLSVFSNNLVQVFSVRADGNTYVESSLRQTSANLNSSNLFAALTNNFTGRVIVADGTAGSPSVQFTSDADGTGTGIYRSGANIVSVAANGTENLRITSTTLNVFGTAGINLNSATTLVSDGSDTLQIGSDANGTPSTPTASGPDGITGTDRPAGGLILHTGLGTGNAVPVRVKVTSSIPRTSSDTTAQVAMSAMPVGATLKVDTTDVGNVGAGEDNLISYTVPAGTLGVNGDSLEFDCYGKFVSSANSKQVKAMFGATTIIATGALNGTTLGGVDWRITGRIIRISNTAQEVVAQFSIGGTLLGALTSTIVDFTEPAETLSGTVVFKCTGEATDNDEIVQEGLLIKWTPAN